MLGQDGERRIDSIAFQSPNGNYVIGNDIDKLLSGAKIIYEKNDTITKTLDTLWLNVTKKLIEHRRKHQQIIDPYNEDIAPLLFRYSRFSSDIKNDIKQKTCINILINLKQEKKSKNKNIKNIRHIVQQLKQKRQPYTKPTTKIMSDAEVLDILNKLNKKTKPFS